MKFDFVFLIAFNALARLFGVLAVVAGIIFLVSAYAIKENRFLDIVIALFLMVMGIASLLAKSIKAGQLARMRRRMGRPKADDDHRHKGSNLGTQTTGASP
jgi:DMSO/TMAO reductase YedYZ heme-binding membrane subunit